MERLALALIAHDSKKEDMTGVLSDKRLYPLLAAVAALGLALVKIIRGRKDAY